MVKPATPLPWTTNNSEVIYSQERGGQKGAVAEYGYQRDAAYIVHACNAYPTMVEALRLVAARKAIKPETMAAFLLRELGEAE